MRLLLFVIRVAQSLFEYGVHINRRLRKMENFHAIPVLLKTDISNNNVLKELNSYGTTIATERII
jgi:hypothetical protein